MSIAPSTAEKAAAADIIELNCAADGPPLRIPVGSGRTYHIVASGEAVSTRLAHEAMRSSAVERVPGHGGLLLGNSVLENIVLPAVYHGRIAGGQLAAAAYDAFDACGFDRAQADALCGRPIFTLDGFEQRLICLLRALLMRPAALLCERLFEGVPQHDMERIARFPGYYRRVIAQGTILFLDIAGMAQAQVPVDLRVDAG